ncbi:putative hemolysin [Shewanella surugensis]|uniref:DUF333 domain-containing protein n=1 Tax=Shewanella surugensis TaxID=212020 RepID=A0ABT0LAM4_9GAMM|nr:DUF333 domain-containing protein [Shewanella surugensis]MCL1124407.1 DUF333 domain-containing protein [Shewanella surugensis]
MRKIIGIASIIFSVAALAGCSPEKAPEKQPEKLGLKNPASQYCVSLGGSLDIKTEKTGQVGYCTLPGGKVIEEWTLFRRDHPTD